VNAATATVDYTSVTEAPGTAVTGEALDMLWTRYAFASQYCRDRDVLEVACGSGQGLAHLRTVARRVVGGDFTDRLLRYAHAEYAGDAVELLRLDAQQLPFASGSFDVVILFEALYYLADPQAFVRETVRVLRPGGRLVLCTANPEWRDFNPSPHSHRYLSAGELMSVVVAAGLRGQLFGGFRTTPNTARDHVVSFVKRAAVSLHLVPRTMKGKRLLKRLFLGRLMPVPRRIVDGQAAYLEPVPTTVDQAPSFRVLYLVAART
jgi:ubiquinone/menaquinone biosynthesis C-methylase UbiE